MTPKPIARLLERVKRAEDARDEYKRRCDYAEEGFADQFDAFTTYRDALVIAVKDGDTGPGAALLASEVWLAGFSAVSVEVDGIEGVVAAIARRVGQ